MWIGVTLRFHTYCENLSLTHNQGNEGPSGRNAMFRTNPLNSARCDVKSIGGWKEGHEAGIRGNSSRLSQRDTRTGRVV